MKVILVGMPGSGKSTFGRQLAQALNIAFIDLDHEIEKAAGKSIKEIFSDRGEVYFREIESRSLQIIVKKEENFVLATGGGTPCFHQGMDVINQSGTSIFLDVPVDEIVSRVKHDNNRPLLQSGDEAELKLKLSTIRAERLSCYQQAKIITKTANVLEVMERIDAFKK
jgi:shikimate kinase